MLLIAYTKIVCHGIPLTVLVMFLTFCSSQYHSSSERFFFFGGGRVAGSAKLVLFMCNLLMRGEVFQVQKGKKGSCLIEHSLLCEG